MKEGTLARLRNAASRLRRSIIVTTARDAIKSHLAYSVLALASFAVFVWWSLPGLYIPYYSTNFLNELLKRYLVLISFEAIGVLALVLYVATNMVDVDEERKSEAPDAYIVDVPFLLSRSDSLDGQLHYLRNGVSIIAGVLTALIVLLSDPNRVQNDATRGLIGMCAVLAFFCAVAIVISLSNAEVYVGSSKLESHLVPSGQSETVYLQQLEAIVKGKSGTIGRMRAAVSFGLILFVFFAFLVAFSFFSVVLGSELAEFAVFRSVFELLYLFFAILSAFVLLLVVGISGIEVVDLKERKEEGKAPIEQKPSG